MNNVLLLKINKNNHFLPFFSHILLLNRYIVLFYYFIISHIFRNRSHRIRSRSTVCLGIDIPAAARKCSQRTAHHCKISSFFHGISFLKHRGEGTQTPSPLSVLFLLCPGILSSGYTDIRKTLDIIEEPLTSRGLFSQLNGSGMIRTAAGDIQRRPVFLIKGVGILADPDHIRGVGLVAVFGGCTLKKGEGLVEFSA